MDLLSAFKLYLFSQEVKPSKVTVKNYLSDINHFIRWYESTHGKTFEPKDVTTQTISLYKKQVSSISYDVSGKDKNEEYKIPNTKYQILSSSSMERHLSSLRKFFKFLKVESLISRDPFELDAKRYTLDADPYRLRDFKSYLYVFNASHLTIKNYLIDIKQFLRWAEEVLDLNVDNGSSENVLSYINSNLVEEYKQRLLAPRSLGEVGFSPATINRKLSSLRKYIAWAESEGLVSGISYNVSSIQEPKPSPVFIPEAKDIQNTKYKIQNTSYSSFPPFRLLQKLTKGINLALDATLITQLVKIIEKAEILAWKIKGQPVFKKVSGISYQVSRINPMRTFGAGDILNTKYKIQNTIPKVKNLPKELYAPLEISTKNFPWYKKAWHNLRYRRPNWYRTYHSYAITHYFHFAVLVIFAAGLVFGFYTAFIEQGSKSPTLAALPTNPPRILSFQGRLTDNNDNPITSGTNLRFAIYRDSTASGSALQWQEVNRVEPDTDGIFNVILGNNTSIPSQVFFENNALWLGVTVEATSELTPRQQIATVAFAANSETLQGLLPITATASGTTNVVLALNSSGNLVIGGSVGSTFQTSGGQFTITGQTVLLSSNAGSNGNIQLAPDGTGKIDLTKPLQNTSISNNIASAVGSVEIDDLLSVLATSSGQSALTINQTGAGPLISASASGANRFAVDNSGNIKVATGTTIDTFTAGSLGLGTTNSNAITIGNSGATVGLTSTNITGNQNSVLYVNSSSNVQSVNTTTQNLCLISGSATPSWTTCPQDAIDTFWNQTSGALFPNNSTVDFLIGGQATTSARFRVIANNLGAGTLAVASISGKTSFASLVVNNDGVGDLFTASSSGTNKFSVQRNGLILAPTYNAAGCTLKADTNGLITCGVDNNSGGSGSSPFAEITGGVIVPNNSTVDFLIGGQATTAAKFALINIAGARGLQTASLSGSLVLDSSTASIQTTNNQLLTVGGNSTGDIQFKPGNSSTSLYLQTGGNVGIGITNPSVKLEIAQQQPAIKINSTGTGTDARILFNTTGIGGWTLGASLGTSTDLFQIAKGLDQGVESTKFAIDASGNVGIGTISPLSLLHLSGGNTGGRAVAIFNQTGAATNDIFTASASGTTRFVIQNDGDVGIGTTTPNLPLHIYGTGDVGLAIDSSINAPYLGFRKAGVNKWLLLLERDTPAFGANANDLVFYDSVNDLPRMVLRLTGNVGIGDTGPDAKLEILSTTEQLRLTNTDNTIDARFTVDSSGNLTIDASTDGTGSETLALTGFSTITASSLATFTTSATLGMTSTTTLNLGSNVTINSGATALNLQADGTPDVNIAGGSGTTGCTIANSTGNLTCTGNISGASTGIQGYWQRASGALSPTNITDDLLLGATSTASSKFAFINVAAGTPTATISGNLSLAVPTTAGANTFNLLNNSTLNFQVSQGGNAGLTTALFIDKQGNAGKVGLGTASPLAPLHISSAGDAAGNAVGFRITNTFGTSKTWAIQVDDTFSKGINFSETGVADARLFLEAGGEIGIGDTTPDAKLEVISTTEQLRLTNTDNTIDARFTVDGSGNLTIDTSSDGTGNSTLTLTGTQTLTASSLSTFTTATTLGISATTLNLGNSSAATIGTVLDDNLTITAAGTGDLILTSDFDTPVLIGTSTNTPAVLSISGGIANNAALIVNNLNNGDLIAASASGVTKFRLDNSGNASMSGSLTMVGANSIQTTSFSTLTLGGATTGQVVLSGFNGSLNGITMSGYNTCTLKTGSTGVVTCGVDNNTGVNWWNQLAGLLSPVDINNDFAVGGTSTASAKFSYTGIQSGQTIASISGQLLVYPNNGYGGNASISAGLVIGANSLPTIQTTKNQLLTIGGNTTGNITLSPNNGTAGLVSISGSSLFTTGTGLTTIGGNLTVNGATVNLGNGSAATIQTPSGNAGISILPNGSGVLNLNTAGTGATNIGTSTNTGAVSIGNTTGDITLGADTITASSLATFTTSATLALNGAATINTDQTTVSLFNSTATTLNIGGAATDFNVGVGGATAGTFDILGGSAATGCTVNGDTGNLTCSGNILTTATTGLQGWWNVASGSLFPTNSTLDFLFGSQASVSARFKLTANNLGAGTLSVASISGRTSFASLVVNNDGVGDLFTASASGWTRFRIAGSGAITSAAYTTGGGVIYTTSNGLFSQTTAGSTNECLKSAGGGTPTWGTCGSGGDSFWGQASGLLYPANSTVDLAIGGVSSASAKFLFANVNSGTPTLKIFDSTKTFSLNLSHDGTNANILSTTGTVNIGQGGGTLYVQTDIQNDSTNNLGAIQITDRLNVLPAATSNINSNAALIVNNPGTGDILTASGAGTTRFKLANTGTITASFYNTCTLKTDTNGLFTCGTDNSGYSPFQELAGAIVPNNSTLDFLIGGQSTASADFAITGISNPNNQVNASLSGQLIVMANNGWGGNATISGALTLGAFSNGVIQTTRNQGLTIGGNTTGNIAINQDTNTAAAITIGGTAQTGTLTFGSSSGTNSVLIANGAGATTLNLANVQVGGAVNIGAGMTTGTITIGGTGLQTGTITFGGGTGAQIVNLGTGGTGVKTVNLGTGTAANVISIGTGQTAGSISLGTAMTSGTISIGGTGLQTGTIDIGVGTGAQTINLGTGGTGAKAINIGTGAINNTLIIGSVTTTAATTLRAGTGDLTLSSTDQLFVNSSKASGGTTTEALSIKSTASLGDADEVLQIGDSAADFLTILGNGAVGIGITSPTSLVHINGGTLGGRAAVIINQTGNAANDLFTASASGTTKVRVLNAGTIQAPSFYDLDNLSYFLDPAATATSLDVLGGIAVGTTTPLAQTGLHINKNTLGNTAVVINQLGSGELIAASLSGTTQFLVKNNGDTVIGPGGVGKITVTTIDPLYTIDGTRYSTYAPSMVGVKEEVTGKAALSYNQTRQAYSYTIALNGQEMASDLWLFARVTDLDVNLTSVLLTPDSSAKVWYEKDSATRSITFFADRKTSLSYRLTAPRFDHETWANLSDETNPGITGLIAPPAPDGTSTIAALLNSTSNSGNFISDEFTIGETLSKFGNTTYSLVDSFGNAIKIIQSFSDILVANIQAGAINAKEITTNALNITTENITLNGQSLRNYIASLIQEVLNNSAIQQFSNQGIISPIASINEIHTDLITPLANNHIEISGDINVEGSATISGTIRANQLSIRGNLDASDASISGTLRAGKILASDIVGLNIQASTVSANYITNNYYSASASSNPFPTLSAQPASGSGIQDTKYNIQNTNFISVAPFASELAYVENLNAATATFSQGLMVFGPTTLSDTSIVGQLSVNGSLILADNSINVLGSDLNLQPLKQGGLSIMAGLIYIDTNGNATFEKDATVKGTLYANAISSLPGQDLTLKLASNSSEILNTKYKIQNTNGSDILSVNQLGDLIASGAGTFSKLNLGLVSPALALSPTEVIATGSAGTGSINAGRTQMTINNQLVTDKSLIYITPTTNTNQTLFLLRQVPGDSFTVGIQNPNLTPIQFNWIIVN